MKCSIEHTITNYIKDALLWTDTITTFFDKITGNNATREHMLSFQKEPVKIDKYMDRLASFPTNLRFVAKKMALYFQNNGISLSSIIKPGFNPIINPIIEVDQQKTMVSIFLCFSN
jgi:hypothetical protein